jgi:hypothetical protein
MYQYQYQAKLNQMVHFLIYQIQQHATMLPPSRGKLVIHILTKTDVLYIEKESKERDLKINQQPTTTHGLHTNFGAIYFPERFQHNKFTGQ